MKTGAQLIAEERQRQQTVEGWTPEHDDQHTCQELLRAGICYAMTEVDNRGYAEAAVSEWPFAAEWFKNGGVEIRNLVKAGALIAAEIDRLQRIASPKTNNSFTPVTEDADGVSEKTVQQSIEVIRTTGRANCSILQRRLHIGYTCSARVMDILEERGIVGPHKGVEPRDILIPLEPTQQH